MSVRQKAPVASGLWAVGCGYLPLSLSPTAATRPQRYACCAFSSRATGSTISHSLIKKAGLAALAALLTPQ